MRDGILKKRKVKPAALSRAKKLARLGAFSKRPAETLREQCPTRLRISFHIYHYDKQKYLPLGGTFVATVVRNPREFARLRKHIAEFISSGAYQDERNERKPEPPSLEKQLDPSLHGHPLDADGFDGD